MIRRCYVLPLFVLLVCAPAHAQGNRVILQVVVSYEGDRQPLQDEVTIQLMDGWGAIDGEQRTTHGMAQFLTLAGIHRLRVSGPTIEESYTEFTLRGDQPEETEPISVQRKAYAYTIASGKGAIAAVRLKIPPKAEKEFEKGARAIDKKNWPEARESFQRAIALYPEYDMAYNGLGVAALNTSDTEGARRAFERAISLNDGYGDAYRNLARILMSERKYEDADATLKKALKSDPLDAWTLTYAAYAELLTGKFDEALANARKVHTGPHAGFASAHMVAARALEATRHADQALEEYRLYLKEDPQGRDAKAAREAEARLTAAGHPPGD